MLFVGGVVEPSAEAMVKRVVQVAVEGSPVLVLIVSEFPLEKFRTPQTIEQQHCSRSQIQGVSSRTKQPHNRPVQAILVEVTP